MRFRRRKESNIAEQYAGFEPEEAVESFEPPPAEPGRHRWSTAFLMVGSAMVGATALALWNRRTLENMRTQIKAQPEPAAPPRDEEEIV